MKNICEMFIYFFQNNNEQFDNCYHSNRAVATIATVATIVALLLDIHCLRHIRGN